jgi:hypothetical protein
MPALGLLTVEDLANTLRSLDAKNESDRTAKNKEVKDEYQKALIHVGLAFGIVPSRKFVIEEIDT